MYNQPLMFHKSLNMNLLSITIRPALVAHIMQKLAELVAPLVQLILLPTLYTGNVKVVMHSPLG